jgi:hypothetical protein
VKSPSMRRQVGVKSILFSFREITFVGPPSGRCRHASIRTLEERLVSLGACWAFLIQPVLPSVWRPVVLLLQSGTWARRLTQSPELGFRLLFFSLPGTILNLVCVAFMRLPALPHGCGCARARTLLRSPTGDAAALPAFLQWRRSLASSRSSRRVRPASVPSVAGHSRCRMVPRCVVLPAPSVRR